jgi:GT2 family glycosyltransferase
LDDDAHPLQNDFIEVIEQQFGHDNELAIIAFQEIKGIFKSDFDALNSKPKQALSFLCSEFVGCGFAIRKESYLATRGFPTWIDIYGEESCVSIEVLANNERILYTNAISVNHRVDLDTRKKAGQNYFRFEKQLKNSVMLYLVYYRNPILKIIKLLHHNFIRYAIKDFSFFKLYFRAVFKTFIKLPLIIKYRKPVDRKVILIKNKLPSPIFH